MISVAAAAGQPFLRSRLDKPQIMPPVAVRGGVRGGADMGSGSDTGADMGSASDTGAGGFSFGS
jgi:hypothetical protein